MLPGKRGARSRDAVDCKAIPPTRLSIPLARGARLLDQLGQQLAQEFGRGFESRNLRRMVKFAEAFPDVEIVSTLSTP